MPADSLSLRAHAKLNLALAVGPTDPASEPTPGLHPICSWMHPIDLADQIHLSMLGPGEPSRFKIAWADRQPIDWPLEQDLAFRAHAALEHHVGRPLPSRVEISKAIPAGGGLGGGSSDAATTLLGLNTLFSLGLSEADLVALSTPLGSDIAFFLDTQPELGQPPRPAIVSGFGAELERTARAESEVTLILPPFGCPTGAVYAAYDQHPNALDSGRVHTLASQPLQPETELFNDLAEPACRVQPQLKSILDALNQHAEHPCHITGSGSTCFTLSTLASLPNLPAECTMLPTKLV